MAKDKGRIEINEIRCKGCGLCITECKYNNIVLCEKNILNVNKIVAVFVNNNGCNSCSFCAIICPDTAIEVYRKNLIINDYTNIIIMRY